MAHRLDKYLANLSAIVEANKAIVVSDEPETQKVIGKLMAAHTVVLQQISAINRQIKIDTKAADAALESMKVTKK